MILCNYNFTPPPPSKNKNKKAMLCSLQSQKIVYEPRLSFKTLKNIMHIYMYVCTQPGEKKFCSDTHTILLLLCMHTAQSQVCCKKYCVLTTRNHYSSNKLSTISSTLQTHLLVMEYNYKTQSFFFFKHAWGGGG